MATNQIVAGFYVRQTNQEMTVGYACRIDVVGFKTDIKAMLGPRTVDPIIVGAGIAEKGAQKITVIESDLPFGLEEMKHKPIATTEGYIASWLWSEVQYGQVSAYIGDPSGYKQGEHGFI